MDERMAWPRVVVTGMGIVTPLGCGLEASWAGALAGRSTARRITRFDPSDFQVQIAATVDDFDPEQWMDRREARRFDRMVQFSVAAALEALAQSGLRIEPERADRVGVIIGTGIGGLQTIETGFEALHDKGPNRVSPLTGAMMLPDMAAGQVSIMIGALGPNFSIASACATGSHAIGEAFEIIRRGDADVMLAGASEAGLTRFGLAAFHRTGAMSTRNDDPETASRPFERDRDGFVFGEGAGVLVLEREDHALARAARPLAELVGYGSSADAFHVSAPREDGSGAARAMRMALAKAGLGPGDVDYINAHGTGTVMNDLSETRAIKTVFGEQAYRIPVSSTKSMHGHLLGAAGGVEAVLAVQTLIESVLPPTINYFAPDPECDLDYVPNQCRRLEQPLRTVLSNSFGFGGHNATVLFRRHDAEA